MIVKIGKPLLTPGRRIQSQRKTYTLEASVMCGTMPRNENVCVPFMCIGLLSSTLLCDGLKIPLARLLGLDVDSIISEMMMLSKATPRSFFHRSTCERGLNNEISKSLWLCSLIFQVIVHPIASFKISDNGLISGIKYGCRYFLIHVGVMLIVFTCLRVYFELLYEITIGVVGFICTTSFMSCLIQFLPPEHLGTLLNT